MGIIFSQQISFRSAQPLFPQMKKPQLPPAGDLKREKDSLFASGPGFAPGGTEGQPGEGSKSNR
jgi:hypothetical protein